MNIFRRVGLVAFSCIILFLSLICPVCAADTPQITRSDFIDLGFMEYGDGTLYLPANSYNPLSIMDIMLVSEPNSSDFTPNDIPWSDSPQYIQDIISMGFDNVYELTYGEEVPADYKMPFICILVRTSDILVYAGTNLCIGINLLTNSVRVCGSSWFDIPACYSAVYRKSDMALITPWYEITGTDWGDTGYIQYYSPTLASLDSCRDMYFYGGTSIRPGTASVSVSLLSYNEDALFSAYNSYNNVGFQNGIYFPCQGSFTTLYCSYFKPSFYTNVDSSIIDDVGSVESNLMNGYNPDDISSDLSISIDSSSWEAVFSIFNIFVTSNGVIVTLVITMLTLGFLALLLNR